MKPDKNTTSNSPNQPSLREFFSKQKFNKNRFGFASNSKDSQSDNQELKSDNQELKSDNQKLKSDQNNSKGQEKSQKSEKSEKSFTQKLFDSYSGKSEQSQKQIKVEKNLNVLFYLNEIPSQTNGEFIDKMHANWWNDYERLESNHSFIQWIFPNSFQSRFNSSSQPLNQPEIQHFRANQKIAYRYVKSYEMMLNFYGMKLKNKATGEITRSRVPDYKDRYHKTLLTSFHNHMRITRILCSLTLVGFGRYAKQLCTHLKYEINNENGQLRSLKRYDVYKPWSEFDNYKETQEDLNIYLINLDVKNKEKTKEQVKPDQPKEK